MCFTSPSMDMAEKQVTEHLLTTFKPEDGWSKHSMVIESLKKDFVDNLVKLLVEGIIVLEDYPIAQIRVRRLDSGDMTRTDILDSANNVN